MEKQYINANTLLDNSFELALNIVDSGYTPELIVGLWRGGTPIAIAVQEALSFMGKACDHIAIRTISYSGIGERNEVKVDGLDYINAQKTKPKSILLVDDIFDTGLSMDKVIQELSILYQGNLHEGSLPDIKIATAYFKPNHNLTNREPDFYLFKTAHWIVFPHELEGLSEQEIMGNKALSRSIKEKLLKRKQSTN